MPHRFLVTCPKGLERLLAEELRSLVDAVDVSTVKEGVAAAYFESTLACAYRVMLWSRLANRVILLLGQSRVASGDELYDFSLALPWAEWFDASQSISIDFNGTSNAIRNSSYGQQRVKDAINDAFVGAGQSRLRIDAREPDIAIYARLFRNKLAVGIDLVGESLHQRGYRARSGVAPLKENLAAALLMQCDWPAIHARGGAFADLFCGTGTLLVEAALMALGVPPSYKRTEWPHLRLRQVDDEAWRQLGCEVQAGIKRMEEASQGGSDVAMPVILGSDIDERSIAATQQNIEAAGLQQVVRVRRCSVADFQHRVPVESGLILVNPPYGERMGDEAAVAQVYKELGETLAHSFVGWEAGILTGKPELGWQTGFRSWRQYRFFNGNLSCELQRYRLDQERRAPKPPLNDQSVVQRGDLSEGATMLANRLDKNRRRLKKFLQQDSSLCYRLYDADLPEYAVAIDCYPVLGANLPGQAGDASAGKSGNSRSQKQAKGKEKGPQRPSSAKQLMTLRNTPENRQLCFHVQEYAPPASVKPEVAARRLKEARLAISAVFEVPLGAVYVKQRQRQRGKEQYQRNEGAGNDVLVTESGLFFVVNFERYLDTGLFLDSRPVRWLIREEVKGEDFLNLFCYTGTATLAAIRGGARSTTSVDLSATYLGWMQDNLALNDLVVPSIERHGRRGGEGEASETRLVQADCLQWLDDCEVKYGCILLDPPSFSNSQRMDETLDISRDQVELVDRCMRLLVDDGRLYFVNNRRGFKLDPVLHERYAVEDLTAATTAPDFQRQRPAHQCWRLSNRAGHDQPGQNKL